METFVVRVFVPVEDDRGPLRGVVEHVGTGSREPFQGGDRLIGFLQASVAGIHEPERRATRTKGERS
jgi:hypothetical protein